MGYEIELKFLGYHNETIKNKLHTLGAVSRGVHLERNIVFDTSAASLFQQKKVLRLRTCLWAECELCVLTLKAPVEDHEAPADVKVRREYEITFTDKDAAETILRELGYCTAFGYDKIREEWVFGDAIIALDTLLFGDVIEIEGSRDAIFETARLLNLDMATSSTASYHKLNKEWRRACHMQDDSSFTFDTEIVEYVTTALRTGTQPVFPEHRRPVSPIVYTTSLNNDGLDG